MTAPGRPTLVDPQRAGAAASVTPIVAHMDLPHARSVFTARNGTPETKPYRWRPGDAQRDAEVAAQLAATRARLAAKDGDR